MEARARPLDPRLPALRTATDDGAMAVLLAGRLEPAGRSEWGGRLEVRHRVLKHTPGKRCVLRYRLAASGGSGPARVLVGKLYRPPRGERIFALQAALWDAAGRLPPSAGGFGMPEPLAYLPELSMILQTAVPGWPLTGLSAASDWGVALRQSADNLACLHRLSPPGWDRRGIASGNPFTVRALAYICAGHLTHHATIVRERYLQ